MPISERISTANELRAWTDSIPFHYEYTAGVAGEKFLRGLVEGKILAAKCDNCGKKYLPPKTYCVDCYLPTTGYVSVGSKGVVGALALSHVSFEGRRLSKPKQFAFVTFRGVTGGLVHYARGKGLKVGSEVEARFKPEKARRGSLLDIEEFVS